MLCLQTSRCYTACCYGGHARQLKCQNLSTLALKRLHQHGYTVARKHLHWRPVATSADTPNKSSRGMPATRKQLADPEYAWLAAQLHPTRNKPGLRLDKVHTGSDQLLWWQCQGCPKCGRVHEWKARVRWRAGCHGKPPTGCASCTAPGGGPGLVPCFCRSVASDAELSREWCKEENKGVLPKAVALWSQKKRVWRCLRDPSHAAYWATPLSRSKGTGCPECGKEASRLRTNRGRLSEEHPELAAQWDHERNDCSPAEVSSGSDYKASWICPESLCEHQHRWQATVRSRTSLGCGCPFCSGHKCCPCNSLAGKYPELLAEWDSARNAAEGRFPEQIGPGSAILVWWFNNERGSWQQSPNQRVTNLQNRLRKEGLQRAAGQLDTGVAG